MKLVVLLVGLFAVLLASGCSGSTASVSNAAPEPTIIPRACRARRKPCLPVPNWC